MAQIIITFITAALVLCGVWTNVVLSMGASPEASTAIALLVLGCAVATEAMLVEDWPLVGNLPLWTVPSVASAFAVGSPPSVGNLIWIAVSVAIATIMLSDKPRTGRILTAMLLLGTAVASL